MTREPAEALRHALKQRLPPRAYRILRAGFRRTRRWRAVVTSRLHRCRPRSGLLTRFLVRARSGRATIVLVSSTDPSTVADGMRSVGGGHSDEHSDRDRLTAVYVLDHSPVIERELAQLTDRVAVHRFWRDAAPAHGGIESRIDTTALSPGPVPGDREWLTGYYRDGLPAIARSTSGGTETVLHYDAQGKPARRDEVDATGILVRVADLDPITGRDVTHRYLNSSGTCWLSVRLAEDGRTPRSVLRHHPVQREYRRLADAHASWLAEHGLTGRTGRALTVGATSKTVAEALGLVYSSPGA